MYTHSICEVFQLGLLGPPMHFISIFKFSTFTFSVPVTGENVEVINLYLDELVESLGFSKDVDLSSYDPHDNDTIFQVMKIAKGRKLIIRMIRYLFKDQRVSVVQSVIAHLANLVKRDCRDKVCYVMNAKELH